MNARSVNENVKIAWWARLSLRARVLLMLFGVLILTQFVTLTLITLYRQNFVARNTADILPVTLRLAREALLQQPPSQRAEYVTRLSRGTWQIIDSVDERSGATPKSLDMDRAMKQLRRLMGPHARLIFVETPEPSFLVSLEQTGGQWIKIPISRIHPPTPWPLLSMWLVFSVLVFALAAWFSWHLTKPLLVMAQATRALAKGTPERVVPQGPAEVRELGVQFNQMLSELELAQRNRDVMLAGLPHDLKTPLTRIRLRAAMSDDAVLRDGLTTDVEQMQSILDQFLQYARGANKITYTMQPCRIDHWLQEYALRWTQPEQKVQLMMDESKNSQPMRVLADSTALARLMDNLIANALHYGAQSQQPLGALDHEDSVVVTLRFESNQAVISVIDHGSGIAPEDRDKAFDPFVRLHSARTADGHSGLGLSIAQGIAQAHQSQLTLEDTPGGGLTVRLALPLVST